MASPEVAGTLQGTEHEPRLRALHEARHTPLHWCWLTERWKKKKAVLLGLIPTWIWGLLVPNLNSGSWHQLCSCSFLFGIFSLVLLVEVPQFCWLNPIPLMACIKHFPLHGKEYNFSTLEGHFCKKKKGRKEGGMEKKNSRLRRNSRILKIWTQAKSSKQWLMALS